jgi:hypothetical protein
MAPRKRPKKRRVNYRRYIRSAKWFAFRKSYFEVVPEECVICGSKEHVNLHHRTYERLGHERFEDVVPLCRAHHDRLHKVFKEKYGDSSVTLSQFTEKYIQTYKKPKKKL